MTGDPSEWNEIPDVLDHWVLGLLAVHWMALGLLQGFDNVGSEVLGLFVRLLVNLLDLLHGISGSRLARSFTSLKTKTVFIELIAIEAELLSLLVQFDHVVLDLGDVNVDG